MGIQQGHSTGEYANACKYLAADAAYEAAERAVLTHGGMGYAKEYHVERYFREAMLPRLAPVSREMILNCEYTFQLLVILLTFYVHQTLARGFLDFLDPIEVARCVFRIGQIRTVRKAVLGIHSTFISTSYVLQSLTVFVMPFRLFHLATFILNLCHSGCTFACKYHSYAFMLLIG